jgi:thiol-disulfide isomerase/thioredoxin
MKKVFPFLLALFALTAVSCNQDGKKTVISGTLPLDYQFIDTLSVYFEDSLLVEAPVDTVSGAYRIEIPVDITKLAIMATPYFQAPFVSDGNALTLSLKEDEQPKLVAAPGAEAGLTGRLNNYMKAMTDIQMAVMEEMEQYDPEDFTEEEIMAKAAELMEPYEPKIKDLNVNAIRENSDNIISVYALMSSEMDEDFPALLQGLSPEIKARKDVKLLLDQMSSVGATSPGGRFLDFEASLDCNNLEGTKVHLSDYVGKGKFILLDFWASWCGPCRAEVPYIKAAYEAHIGDNFDVVSVALNDEPDDSALAAVELGIVWNSLVGAGTKPGELYGITAIPHLILFAPDGTILARGFRGAQIEETLAKFLQ